MSRVNRWDTEGSRWQKLKEVGREAQKLAPGVAPVPGLTIRRTLAWRPGGGAAGGPGLLGVLAADVWQHACV